MSTPSDDIGTRAARQAEGLLALACLIEQHPKLAAYTRVSFQLAHAFVPDEDDDPRARLLEFRRLATAAGAETTVDNGPKFCTVAAAFGPVVLRLHVKAERMAGQEPRPAVAYRPLDDIDPASEEC